MEAYCYSITHIPSGKFYYGVRKSKIEDIGRTYFSSSKLLKRLIDEEGFCNFLFKVRKKFNSYEDARKHETKFLTRINAIKNKKCLNQAISSPRICSKDSNSEKIRCHKISKTLKRLWQTEEYRKKQSKNILSSYDYSQLQKKSVEKRKENLLTGTTKKRKRSIKTYKNVIIVKDSIQKTIKSNQVSAYMKCGWNKI